MRTAGLLVGLVGGMVGIVSALAAMAVGGANQAAGHAGTASLLFRLGWLALVFALVGILGAGLATGKPRLGAGLLLAAAVGITASISLFAVVAAPLLLIAAFLAFAGRVRPARVGRERLADVPVP